MVENTDELTGEQTGGRLPIWLASGFIIALSVWAIVEFVGWTDWVTYSLPLSATDFAQIASGVGSVVLSFGLLLLYNKQAQIQNRQTTIQSRQTEIQSNQESLMQEQTTIQASQESLMEQRFTPYLTGEVAPLNITSAQFLIRNSGDGPAFNVEAEWEIAGEKRSWEVPSLPSGEQYGFPVIVDGENWLLSTGEIEDYLEEQDASSTISYKITCNNRFGNERKFEDSVDFSVLISRSDSNEIWEDDPLEEISNEVSKMQRDMRKMQRYARNNDNASNWKHRIQQTETIRQLIQEHNELSVDQLNSLTSIHEGNIEYRLDALESTGAIHYNENTKIAKSARGTQSATLDEF